MARSAVGIAPTLFFITLLAQPSTTTPAELPRAVEESREHAVELARSGLYENALQLIGELRAVEPTHLGLIYDETAILGWAERDAAVLANARLLETELAPDFVLVAIGKAARNLGQYDAAADWYRRAIDQTPTNVEALLGLAMTHADQRDTVAAAKILDALPSTESGTLPTLLTRAYVENRAARPLRALHHYEEALTRSPGLPEALRGKALMLRELLLPTQALEFAAQHPGVLSDAELARLRADEAALKLRLTAATLYPPSLRSSAQQRSLDAIDRTLVEVADPAARLALQADRVSALVEAGDTEAAIEQFEELQKLTETIAPYAIAAAARAYQQQKRPERAVELLVEAIARNPGDRELQFNLVFAYVDAEQHEDAMRLSRRIAEELPLIPAQTGVVDARDERLRAELLYALVEAYADQLDEAQTRLERLLEPAPNNADFRQELANVYRWRGWLRQSEFQYRQVLSLYPDLLSARVGYAHARLDAAALDEVSQTVADLNASYPDDQAVRRLTERWELHQRGELSLSTSDGASSGATFGSEQRSWNVSWMTGPIGRFHGIARIDDFSADIPEGEGRLQRFGVGTEFRSERWLARSIASNPTEGEDDLGVLVNVEWRLDDYWYLGGLIDVNSADTPLRGRRLGIDSNVAGISAEYRANEGTAVSLGWRYRDFSDGNSGVSWFADGRRRLLNEPQWKLDLTGEVSASLNRFEDLPYFSPRHDASAMLGLRHEWRLYRRYDRSIVQLIDVQAGRYDQAEFPGANVWRLRYGFSLQLSNALGIEFSAQRARMFYDGQPEYSTFFTLGLTARL